MPVPLRPSPCKPARPFAQFVAAGRARTRLGGDAVGVLAEAGRLEQVALERHGPHDGPQPCATGGGLLDSAASGTDRLTRVDDFFNRRIRFGDDSAVWKQADYWATRWDIAAGAGDCEDFAIQVRHPARGRGAGRAPASDLRAGAHRRPAQHHFQAHMVVGYYPEPFAEPLILDNLIGEIRPASRRGDLFPIFSFTSAGLWVSGRGRFPPPTRLPPARAGAACSGACARKASPCTDDNTVLLPECPNMSLIKQLWIATLCVTLLALGGSLVVGTLSARGLPGRGADGERTSTTPAGSRSC